MVNQDNPYKLQIEYDEQTEENPFNPNIHKSRSDFKIIPEELGTHRVLSIMRYQGKRGKLAGSYPFGRTSQIRGLVGRLGQAGREGKEKIGKEILSRPPRGHRAQNARPPLNYQQTAD